MYQKILSLLLAFMALLFVGSGITGFATLTSTSIACDENSDCRYAVCCPRENNYGLCAQKNECDEIYINSVQGIMLAPEESDAEKAEQSYVAISLGLIILTIIAIISYVEWQQQKRHPKEYAKTHGLKYKK